MLCRDVKGQAMRRLRARADSPADKHSVSFVRHRAELAYTPNHPGHPHGEGFARLTLRLPSPQLVKRGSENPGRGGLILPLGTCHSLAARPAARSSWRLRRRGRLLFCNIEAQLDQLAESRGLAVQATVEAIVGHALPQLVVEADLSAVRCGCWSAHVLRLAGAIHVCK